MYTIATLILPTVLLASLTGTAPTRLEKVLDEVANPEPPVVKVETALEKEPQPTLKISCIGCSENETTTLNYLWNYGIKDKYALATIMGNIRQESGFHANICEGGARVPYNQCHSGGYGLIQWTTSSRYYGLGSFANRNGGDPSTITTQLGYMVEEVQWKRALKTFKTPGLSVDSYMNAAYTWLGWGIHGNRTHFANQYLNKIIIS